MYIVTIHNGEVSTPIHNSKEKLTSGKITKGINTIDSFQFSMLPSNAGFEQIYDYITLVSIYNTNHNRYEFFGRVLYSDDSMSESGAIQKDVICESYFGFLCDSQQTYVAEKNWTVIELLKHIVNTHNSQVESYKQFTIGEVTVTDPNDNIYIGIQRENTWETLKKKLIDQLGGEIRFRVEDDVIYLDYLIEIGEKSSTEITLSRNMKSISREKDPSEIVTRLIPLGCKQKTTDSSGNEVETEERLDITSVNNGKNYIEDENAVAKYGIRVKTVEFNDVTVASTLLVKGNNWLAENNKVKINYTATALDLSLIGLDVDDFEVCNYHTLKNPLLNIDDTVRIIKKNIDICEEVKSTITFGDNFEMLSEAMKKQSEALSSIPKDYVTNQRLTSEIEKTSTLIKQTETNIKLDVTQKIGPLEIAISEIEQKYDSIELAVWDLDDALSQTLRIAADGVTITNYEGSTFFINGGQIKANTIEGDSIKANTVITAPIIKGGQFFDDDQNVWLELGAQSGNYGLILGKGDGTGINRIFSIYDAETTNTSFNAKGFNFLRIDANTETIYPYGTLNLTEVNIVQPYFLIDEITSSTITIGVLNIKPGDEITVIARPLNSTNTAEQTLTSEDTDVYALFKNMPASTYLEIGVKVNGNYIGFRVARTTAS